MVEQGVRALVESITGMIDMIVNFWTNIPFWYAISGITAVALLIYWLVFKK
jgi:hypothetical protein